MMMLTGLTPMMQLLAQDPGVLIALNRSAVARKIEALNGRSLTHRDQGLIHY